MGELGSATEPKAVGRRHIIGISAQSCLFLKFEFYSHCYLNSEKMYSLNFKLVKHFGMD